MFCVCDCAFINAIFILGSLITALYWYLTINFDYWTKRNVVSLPAWPVIGSKLDALRMQKHTAILNEDIYNKYKDKKFVGGFQGGNPELMLFDPELIRNVLAKDFDSFHDRGVIISADKEPLTQHLFFLNGDSWKSMRQKITPIFTSAKMKNMLHLIVECGEEFQRHLAKFVGNEVEFRTQADKFTIDSIGSCAFGLNMVPTTEENTAFRVMTGKIFDFSIVLRSLIRVFAPKLFYMLDMKVTKQEVEDFFVNLCRDIMKQRVSGSSRHDLIDLMIELKMKGYIEVQGVNEEAKEKDIPITDEMVAAQAFVFYVAGFDTSSATISYALHEIALNFDIQEKIHAEIDSVLHRYGGQITYDAIGEMKYLGMVISETLRKYPPGASLMRVSKTPYQFPLTELKITKGVNVLIPIYALHHDPEYYPEPEKFIPERFTPDAIKKRHPFVYLPFGEGPRRCIGVRFARLQTTVGLVSLLQKYLVAPCEKTVVKLEPHPRSPILKSKSGIWLRLKHRSNNVVC